MKINDTFRYNDGNQRGSMETNWNRIEVKDTQWKFLKIIVSQRKTKELKENQRESMQSVWWNEHRCKQWESIKINENLWNHKTMKVPKNINGRQRESVEISWNQVEVKGNQWIFMKTNENQR